MHICVSMFVCPQCQHTTSYNVPIQHTALPSTLRPKQSPRVRLLYGLCNRQTCIYRCHNYPAVYKQTCLAVSENSCRPGYCPGYMYISWLVASYILIHEHNRVSITYRWYSSSSDKRHAHDDSTSLRRNHKLRMRENNNDVTTPKLTQCLTAECFWSLRAISI